MGAEFAGVSIGDAIVGWTQDLEIVEMVKDRDALTLQFPENRGREVVVDAANVGEVGRKIGKTITHRGAG